MFETHGWARRRGSPPLTLSTPLSFATEEGCRSTFWWKPFRCWMKCKEKYSRSSSDWETYGTGDRLLIQSGTLDNLISIPLTQAEADMTSDWWGIGWEKHGKNFLRYDHFCFVGMGDHYLQFDYTPEQVLPLQKESFFLIGKNLYHIIQ